MLREESELLGIATCFVWHRNGETMPKIDAIGIEEASQELRHKLRHAAASTIDARGSARGQHKPKILAIQYVAEFAEGAIYWLDLVPIFALSEWIRRGDSIPVQHDPPRGKQV